MFPSQHTLIDNKLIETFFFSIKPQPVDNGFPTYALVLIYFVRTETKVKLCTYIFTRLVENEEKGMILITRLNTASLETLLRYIIYIRELIRPRSNSLYNNRDKAKLYNFLLGFLKAKRRAMILITRSNTVSL